MLDSAMILFGVMMLAAFLAIELRKELVRWVLKLRPLYRVHRVGNELPEQTCKRLDSELFTN